MLCTSGVQRPRPFDGVLSGCCGIVGAIFVVPVQRVLELAGGENDVEDAWRALELRGSRAPGISCAGACDARGAEPRD